MKRTRKELMYTILGTTIAIAVTFTFLLLSCVFLGVHKTCLMLAIDFSIGFALLFALGLIEKGEPHEKEHIANSDSIDTHNERDSASQGE